MAEIQELHIARPPNFLKTDPAIVVFCNGRGCQYQMVEPILVAPISACFLQQMSKVARPPYGLATSVIALREVDCTTSAPWRLRAPIQEALVLLTVFAKQGQGRVIGL